jgi:hypothetical protein
VTVPRALNIGDGGGKEEGRLLGCGLEKRSPYPRVTSLAGDAPRLGAGSFTEITEINGSFEWIECPWIQRATFR